MSTFTLSGIVSDSNNPVPGVEVFLYRCADPETAQLLTSQKTSADGAWSFDVDAGDYIVGMPRQTVLPDATSAEDTYVFAYHSIAVVKSDVSGVVLKADLIKGVLRTPQNDARYIASIYQTVQQRFEELTKNAASFDEIQAALSEAQAILEELLAPFKKDDADQGSKVGTPCYQCQSKCYGSTDPNCLNKCYNGPPPCT